MRTDNPTEHAAILQCEGVEIIRGVHDGAGIDDILEEVIAIVTTATGEIGPERTAFAIEFVTLATDSRKNRPALALVGLGEEIRRMPDLKFGDEFELIRRGLASLAPDLGQ